jgi:tetraacyldisaccharide 4'-kinase
MKKILKIFLYPVWLIYGIIIFVRNKLYDFKILKSVEFHIPVISVGNITVGGTGKTPHVEYLIRLLKDNYKVAFLSRGYKRKTRDFIVATEQSSAATIGDEPLQVKRKFPELTVAVDRKRVNGIHKLIDNIPELDIILLDDAYQHRAVNPGVNILLIDYNHPLKGDSLLPVGMLREPASEKERADLIVVTKVPRDISAIDKRLFLLNVDARTHQKVYFSTTKYGELKPVFDISGSDKVPALDKGGKYTILLVTGIADPSELINHLAPLCKEVIPLSFPDHYAFTQKDVTSIVEKFNVVHGTDKIIVTTEKDAVRLIFYDATENLPEAWYYIPIEVEFLPNEGELFNNQILHYVKNNNRNSILYQK